jgi:hypothetical protein
MTNPRQLTFDVLAAAALLLALGAVYRLDRGPVSPESPQPKVETQVVAVTENAPARPLRLAVTKHMFDDMGRLLRDLGYKYSEITVEDIASYERIADYDVLFITCSNTPKAWLNPVETPIAPGLFSSTWLPDAQGRVKENLRKFVGNGGTIYVSDLHYTTLNVAFPELMRQPTPERGAKQDVVAKVVDGGLKDVIGSSLGLRFDLGGWCPAAFDAPDVRVYLTGEYRDIHGKLHDDPLLVRFGFDKGAVIFTSFHNEKQNSDKEKELLRYLVFATVTASAESKVTKTMISGGFSPKKSNLLTAAPGDPRVTQTYTSKKSGKLRFALGFNGEGAKLRLDVSTPDGRTFTEEGTASFSLDVPDAKAGDYQYTVTALTVPYANFPFSLTVGEQ